MASLLDLFDGVDDPRMMGLLGLMSGMSTANPHIPGRTPFGVALTQGLMAGAQGYGVAKKAKTEEELKRAELDLKKMLYSSEVEKNAIERQKYEQALKEAQAKQAQAQQQAQFLGSLGQPITGGQAASAGGGPTNAAASMIGQPMPFSPQVAAQAAALGLDLDKVRAIVESKNWGRPEVARTIETTDAQGRPITLQFDKFGQRVGGEMGQWKPPVQVGQGDRTTFVDPVTMQQRGSFGINVSPDAALSSATSRGNALLADARAREANGIAAGNAVNETTMKIRKEFGDRPEVKSYQQAFPAYAAIIDAAKRNTPQSDINLVYGIAKLYDPGSVVREGEYATVAQSPNIPERVKGWAQYLAGGGKLTPEVRSQIVTEAQSRLQAYEGEYLKTHRGYADISRRFMVDPSNVFTSIGRVRADGTLDPDQAFKAGVGTQSVTGVVSFDQLPKR